MIESEDLLIKSAATGDYLRRELKGLQKRCQNMGDVRGSGLFISIDWVSDPETKTADVAGAIDMADRLKGKGFLISNAGALDNMVKIRPPLVFDRNNADEFLDAFSNTLTELGH